MYKRSKNSWTVWFKESRAVIGDFHNIIGYEDRQKCSQLKAKEFLMAYAHVQDIRKKNEDAHSFEIRKNGKEGRTVIMPCGHLVWVEGRSGDIKVIDINNNLFISYRKRHPPNQKHNIIILLKSWWGVTPEIFKEYTGLDLENSLKAKLGSLYF